MSINEFLEGILSPFSDRRHRIHLCSAVIFSSLLLSFNLIISDDDVMFRSDNDGFICWRSSSPMNPNSSFVGFSTGIASQLYILGDGYDALGMHGIEVGLDLLFFLVFLWSLCHRLCQNQHITTLLHFLLFSSALLFVSVPYHEIDMLLLSFIHPGSVWGHVEVPYFYLYHHLPHLYPLAALLTTASILITTLFCLLPVAVAKILSLTSFGICIYCIFLFCHH